LADDSAAEHRLVRRALSRSSSLYRCNGSGERPGTPQRGAHTRFPLQIGLIRASDRVYAPHGARRLVEQRSLLGDKASSPVRLHQRWCRVDRRHREHNVVTSLGNPGSWESACADTGVRPPAECPRFRTSRQPATYQTSMGRSALRMRSPPVLPPARPRSVTSSAAFRWATRTSTDFDLHRRAPYRIHARRPVAGTLVHDGYEVITF
jgi:hypothetical protein